MSTNNFFRSKEFIECEDPVDHKGNKTAKDETGFGCVKVSKFSISLQHIKLYIFSGKFYTCKITN